MIIKPSFLNDYGDLLERLYEFVSPFQYQTIQNSRRKFEILRGMETSAIALNHEVDAELSVDCTKSTSCAGLAMRLTAQESTHGVLLSIIGTIPPVDRNAASLRLVRGNATATATATLD